MKKTTSKHARKRSAKLVGMLSAAALLLPAWPATPASAAPNVVSVTNYGADGTDALDDTAGIQAAIDAAAEGDTVQVPAGTYIISAPVKAKSGIKLIGDGRDATIVQYAADSAAAGYMLSLNGTDNVEVAGLTLDGNGNAMTGGITSDPTPETVQNSGHYIHDNRIKNLGATTGFGSFGVLIAHTDRVKITDNDFSGTSVRAPNGARRSATGGTRTIPVIERNTIADTGRGGIFLNDGVEGAVVRHNVVTGSGKFNFGLASSCIRTVNHSVIEDNQ